MRLSEIFEAKKPVERKPLEIVKYNTFERSLVEKVKGRPKLLSQLLDRISHIVQSKNDNPTTRVGGNDGPLHGKLAGYYHCHLTRDPDLSLIYRLANGAIHLYMIAQHDEYQNKKRVTGMAQQLGNASPA